MARKILMDTGALYRLNDDHKILDTIKKAGFKCFDISLGWKNVTEHIGTSKGYQKRAQALRKYADKIGLTCEQSHAYFTNGTTPKLLKQSITYIKQDIEISAIMGAKCTVVHPPVNLSFDENIKFVKALIPTAHKYKVKIAIENIWNSKNGVPTRMCTSSPKEFAKFLDTINDPYVVACLDIGHAEMSDLHTSAIDMIKTLKHRIYCLHIHDNDLKHDSHQMPYTNCIDFKSILEALKKINYQGNITFEVLTCYYHGGGTTIIEPPHELYLPFAKLEYAIGKYFKDYLDK